MEEKKFDVNSFIGMILIGGDSTLVDEFLHNQRFTPNTETTTEQIINSEATASQNNATSLPPVINDSLKQVEIQNQLGAFAYSIVNSSEGTTTLENEVLLLKINNKGGQITEALIKGYKTYKSLPLYMIKDNNSSFNINFGTTDNRILNTKDLFFEPTFSNNGTSQVLSMKLKVSDNQFSRIPL